jgi:type III pantothenate kinase
MLLTIDIGNTNITMGAFEGEELRATWRLSTESRWQPDQYSVFLQSLLAMKGVSPSDIDAVVICSVVPPLTAVFEESCNTTFHTHPLVVGAGTKTGVRVLYEPPRDVGADRVVDAAAAYRLYGGPLVIVDFGTATVFDAVTEEGDYLGGALFPGIHIASEALIQQTSQLRRVELVAPKSAIGRNTVAALQSGLVFGHVALVEGMIARFREELGANTRAIATGGLADLVATQTNVFHAVNPDLTLIGLRMVYDMNSTGDTSD